jgi:hypothetical protein
MSGVPLVHGQLGAISDASTKFGLACLKWRENRDFETHRNARVHRQDALAAIAASGRAQQPYHKEQKSLHVQALRSLLGKAFPFADAADTTGLS